MTTGISLLSLSHKSAVGVVGDLDVDCATGPFGRASHLVFVRAIPPRVVCGWLRGASAWCVDLGLRDLGFSGGFDFWFGLW
jgi:hypothetical protein